MRDCHFFTATPTGVHRQRLGGFIFLVLEPCVAQSLLGWDFSVLSVTPSFYLYFNVGSSGLPATTLPRVLCTNCPSSPLLLIWMNVYSLTPWLLDFHSSIFWQFWLFFIFRLVILLLEVKCIYLHLHLDWNLICFLKK